VARGATSINHVSGADGQICKSSRGDTKMPLLADSLRSLHASITVFAIVVAGLALGRDILLPMALAIVIAFALAQIVTRLSVLGLPHAASASLVLVSAIGTTVAAFIVLSAQLLQITAELPAYRTNIVEKVRAVSGSQDNSIIRRAVVAIDLLEAELQQEIKSASAAAGSAPQSKSGSDADPGRVVVVKDGGRMGAIGDWLVPAGQVALTMLFTAFLLFQHQDLRDRLVRIAGVDNLVGTTAAMSDAAQRLSKLFLGQVMLSSAYGALVAVVLLIIGVPSPLLCGVIAGLMRFVPFVGTAIAMVPPILLAAGVDPGWSMVISTFAFLIAGEMIMGNVVEPLVLGKRSGLSPFAMVVSASFWTLVWGPAGLLLAAPLTLVLVVVGRHLPALEFFSIMLGNEAALRPDEDFYGQLLTRNSDQLAAQLDDVLDPTRIVDTGDRIVLPALALAGLDFRRGRLDDDRLAKISAAMSEVSELANEYAAAKMDAPAQAPKRALVLPARGSVDRAAADFLASCLRSSTNWEIVSGGTSSGLTALASRGGLDADATVDAVVLVNLSHLDRRHIGLLMRRADMNFPKAKLIVFEVDGGMAVSRPDGGNGEFQTVGKVADVVKLFPDGVRNSPVAADAAVQQ
jgi:predicted PurR-regulated permease PerM